MYEIKTAIKTDRSPRKAYPFHRIAPGQCFIVNDPARFNAVRVALSKYNKQHDVALRSCILADGTLQVYRIDNEIVGVPTEQQYRSYIDPLSKVTIRIDETITTSVSLLVRWSEEAGFKTTLDNGQLMLEKDGK